MARPADQFLTPPALPSIDVAEPRVAPQASKHGGPNGPITRVVIHCTDPSSLEYPAASAAGQARGTANYFAQGSGGRNASAHYVTDVAAEFHTLPDNVKGYHAPPNAGSVGIEICGRAKYTRAQWLSPQVWPAVARAASRTRELCDRHRVPRVKLDAAALRAGGRGVCGHGDVSDAWHQTDHWDPGPGFPWDKFMEAVGGASSTPTPTPGDEEDDMFTDEDRKLLQGIRNGLLIDIAEGDDDATEGQVVPQGRMLRSMFMGDYGERGAGKYLKGSLGWLDRRLAKLRRGIVRDVLVALGQDVDAGMARLEEAKAAEEEPG